MKQRNFKLQRQAKMFSAQQSALRFVRIIQRAIKHPSTDIVASVR
jgi:hypothetical protein